MDCLTDFAPPISIILSTLKPDGFIRQKRCGGWLRVLRPMILMRQAQNAGSKTWASMFTTVALNPILMCCRTPSLYREMVALKRGRLVYAMRQPLQKKRWCLCNGLSETPMLSPNVCISQTEYATNAHHQHPFGAPKMGNLILRCTMSYRWRTAVKILLKTLARFVRTVIGKLTSARSHRLSSW